MLADRPMATSPHYRDYIKECLSGIGNVSVRSMFGGTGIFLDGVMFGLIADDVLYFKVDDINKQDYIAEEMSPFTYGGKEKPVEMSYWTAPDRLFDDADDMEIWARKAFDAALRNRKPKRSRKSKT